MNALTPQILERMLETESPGQIREKHGTRLDKDGRTLLEQREDALKKVDDWLHDQGKMFREALPPVPGWNPDHRDAATSLEPAKRAGWWRRTSRIANGWLAAAAAIFFGVVGLSLYDWISHYGPWRNGVDPSLIRTRGGNSETINLSSENDALYQALLNRGISLLEIGKKQEDETLLREALYDLLQARDLKETPRVLRYMALTYEALGDEKKPQELIDRADALEEQDEFD